MATQTQCAKPVGEEQSASRSPGVNTPALTHSPWASCGRRGARCAQNPFDRRSQLERGSRQPRAPWETPGGGRARALGSARRTRLPLPLRPCPGAVGTREHTPDGLKQQSRIVSHFWRTEVQGQGVGQLVLLEAQGRSRPGLWLLSCSWWPREGLSTLGLQARHLDLHLDLPRPPSVALTLSSS